MFKIGDREIGEKHSTYVIAEMSANHNQSFEEAVRIIEKAKECGADAVKLQTYTPDTITIDCSNDYFKVGGGTIWDGRTLYQLYKEAYTPWEWQPKLAETAKNIGIDLFSSPFDGTAVDFLEKVDVPAYKIASFEIVDIPLLEKVARTGKPVIISTGMAQEHEIADAVATVQKYHSKIALLKCTSGYPAMVEEMNLKTIPYLKSRFKLLVGLSDHTFGISVPVAAVALGARIVEKHFTLDRDVEGPDSKFSLEPNEFKEMVSAIRTTERALGEVYLGPSKHEEKSKLFRRSLFVVQDVKKGDRLSAENVRSIRPSYGLPPKHFEEVLGKRVKKDIEKGTPLSWDLIE